ncbi:cytochrome b/b6 domain-containing protein [Flavobacterium sp. NKUCC04_CG]|uniref:cytochrome b/b6 domain-containing protein n=1 Tax=Flavobacterium sp. NKUCC04_CG TaxID=2842121 RepID=UPI001C5B3CA6|nr:cytochrome b/b6 domain-containing protein [Flavobacterium sp. NKUCC04_CG]MBW3519990.1 cytochrome b/b6 domain-containing protein [Flavobacterium sp. NKUCC04_CG]
MKRENKNRFSALHRMLHWIIALAMLVLFMTGFLRMYWMNKRTIISAIDLYTSSDFNIEKDQKLGIAKTILSPMWEWHIYAAYALFFAFVIRVIYMFFQGISFPNPLLKGQALKRRLQGFLYIALYVLLLVGIVTGMYLKWGDGQFKAPMEMVHKWAIYWFPIFVVVHFVGIVIGEYTDKKGIVSKMIGGD